MSHPLVSQLKFARSEFRRGLADLPDEDARKRMLPMNAISWMIGHLAWQEQRYWLDRAQGKVMLPHLNENFASGRPATTPALDETWAAWETITEAADVWLDQLESERISAPLAEDYSSVGTFMYRNIYHYWVHLGEAMAVRQLLGHPGLSEFVGDIDTEAPYRTA
ncbi:MAG: DinB family protein [Chloroflexi bacterium]|nr:DinB family protein [Chloroflexota bacterium]